MDATREMMIAPQTRSQGRVPEHALIQWLRGLADLVDSGVPLTQSLEVLGASRETRSLSAAASRYVERGMPLSFALLGYTPDIVPAILRAGEASGRLPEALRNAAGFLETRQQTRQMLRRELGMPLATAIYTSLVFIFVILVVVPRFSAFYGRLGITPPALTRAIVALSDQLRANWALFLSLFLLIAAAIWRWAARLEVVRRSHLGVFYWALSALLKSGVPIVEALRLAGVASGMDAVYRSSDLAARDVASGEDLVGTLRRHDLVPPDLLVLLGSGATSGRLPEVLESMSRIAHQKVQDTVGRALRWLGGTAILAVGAAILLLATSVYVPVFQLALSALGKMLAPGP